MRAGQLDRPIVIESATHTQDSLGQEIPTWSQWLATYAKWEPSMGTERYLANGTHSVEAGKFTIRYRAGLQATMRIRFDGRIYKITGLAEMTRREGWEITVEIWQ